MEITKTVAGLWEECELGSLKLPSLQTSTYVSTNVSASDDGIQKEVTTTHK